MNLHDAIDQDKSILSSARREMRKWGGACKGVAP
jgi:hypothetical protein